MNKLVFFIALLISSIVILKANYILECRCPSKRYSKDSCNMSKGCIYSSPLNCGSFIQCNATGHAIELPCPIGLVWNNEEKICDWPSSQTCKCLFDCGNTHHCLYANPRNCNSFIMCNSNGNAIELLCPAGHEWNNKSKKCEMPSPRTCQCG